MALIYAGGQWRNVPDKAKANTNVPVRNNAQGSSPAAVNAAAQNRPPSPPTPFSTPARPTVDLGEADRIDKPRVIADTTPTESAEDRYYRERARLDREEAAALRESNRQTAVSFMRDILAQYGMGDLANDIDRMVQDAGSNTSVLMNSIRQTQSYKDRFKGLTALQTKGINDIQNEAEYINLETQYRQVFRDSGTQNFLGTAGSAAERDAIAKLVGDYSLSVNEVKDRVTDAQRVVAETPQEVRDSLQKFYNVDPATLVSYVLDPTRTSTEINRRANAAIVGGFATRAGLEFGAGVSERVGEFFGRGGDISGTAIEPELTQIADVQRSTKRLADIEKGMLSAEESALSTLDLDIEAKEKVRGLQSRERARFGGTSALTSSSLSRGKVI